MMTQAKTARTLYTIKAFSGRPTARLHVKDFRAPQQHSAAQYVIDRDRRKSCQLLHASSAVAAPGGSGNLFFALLASLMSF